jgi:PST family polysaccharide transporter
LLAHIKEKILSKKGLKSILANTTWLLFDKVIRMGVGVVVSVWVARYLGPENFGIFNYVTAFASFFGIVAGLGLDAIVVRELVRTPENESLIMGNAFYAKLGAGVLVLLASVITVLFYRQTSLIDISIVITTAGFIFQSLDVIDFYYQAKVLSKFTVIARNLSFLVLSAFKVFLIVYQYSIIWFVWAASIELAVSALFLAISYFVMGKSGTKKWTFHFPYMKYLVKEAFPLVMSGFVIIIYMRIGQIMLGSMLDQTAVGLYSAAAKLAEIWYFIPTIICSSALPTIIRTRQESLELYKTRLRQLYTALNAISISIALVTAFIAPWLIRFLYGEAFIAAADILSISIWTGVFTFLSVGTGQFLIVENFTRIAFWRNLVSACINVALNLVLIPLYGTKGAAMAILISYFFSVFSLAFFAKTRSHFRVVLESFYRIK